jgi:hypothetical protein
MKILLDGCLPVALKGNVTAMGHKCQTVRTQVLDQSRTVSCSRLSRASGMCCLPVIGISNTNKTCRTTIQRRPFLAVLAFLLAAAFFSAAAASSEPDPKPPFEIVRQLWSLATQGELLHPDGWRRTSGFFDKDEPFPGNELIDVVSNSWAVNHESVHGDNAEVWSALGMPDKSTVSSSTSHPKTP